MNNVKKQAPEGRRTLETILNILFYLIPLIALAVAGLLLYKNSEVILTQDITDEIAFASYLRSKGSHTFADGWVSTAYYFPLGTRFFLTYMSDILSAPAESYLKAVTACYAVFSASFMVFTASLRAKKPVTFIVAGAAGAALGYFLFGTALTGSPLISAASFFLICISFPVLAVRLDLKKLPLPAGIALRVFTALLCAVPVIAVTNHIYGLSGQYGFKKLSFEKECRDRLLQTSPEGEDIYGRFGGLVESLNSKGITDIYSTEEMTNAVYVLSEGKINVVTVDSPTDYKLTEGSDRLPVSDEKIDILARPYYIICDRAASEDLAALGKTRFASEVFSDSEVTLYSYENKDYLFDDDLIFDMSAIEKDESDSFFISNFDVSGYDPEDFMFYTGSKPFIFRKTISSAEDLEYLEIFNSHIFGDTADDDNDADNTENGNTENGNMESSDVADASGENNSSESEEAPYPSLVYLGLDPMILKDIAGGGDAFDSFVKKHITDLMEKKKDTVFQVILPCYCIDHYKDYTKEDAEALPVYYEKLASALSGLENVKIHFMGNAGWIYADPYLYEEGSDIRLNSENSKRVVSNILAAYYLTEPEEVAEKAKILSETIMNYTPEAYSCADLSDTCVLILGDSIFDLFSDDTSIQNIIGNFSGAKVICKAVGGSPAAMIPELEINNVLSGQIADIVPLQEEVSSAMKECKRFVVIMEFGLNDYFQGVGIENPENIYDPLYFKGAMRDAEDAIRTQWPDCELVIMSPGFIAVNDNGNLPFKAGAPNLPEYRKASAELAEEFDSYLFDLTALPEITQESFTDYCYLDFIHYDENGRLLVGRKLIEFLDSIAK